MLHWLLERVLFRLFIWMLVGLFFGLLVRLFFGLLSGLPRALGTSAPNLAFRDWARRRLQAVSVAASVAALAVALVDDSSVALFLACALFLSRPVRRLAFEASAWWLQLLPPPSVPSCSS